ncbi:peptidase G2 autoproteolytic cleavage domain-containing protein, partial [Priestia megaterium]|uniref:peptidase G2 autoproteolytic cleavage domain-containing protein n=1 Tax=Priestia megaterium TaxID=1404 RepID=UPI0025595646
GGNTTATGVNAHAEGQFTNANAPNAHAEGFQTAANGFASHTEGSGAIANGDFSHAEGGGTTASGPASHAEGQFTTASGTVSHAEGSGTTANGIVSHAEGSGTTASGLASHAEGRETRTFGENSHAEGFQTTTGNIGDPTQGTNAHAEGENTTASGRASHAEGSTTIASGSASHAEGASTIASGSISHTEGLATRADAFISHAEGLNTIVDVAHDGAHIMGQNGTTRFPFSWHLANGLMVGPTLNSAVIEGLTGNLYLDGTVMSPNAADYAEMFETFDGNSIEVGYFVTFDGASDKIRKANANDEYILGVISSTPAMIADTSDLRWHNLFVKDEWGKIQYHEVVVPEIKDNDGNVIQPSFTKTEPILNPEWDSSQEYIPRLQRDEWVPVGLVGKLLIRDDCTCQAGSYCKPNDEGIATASNTGYRVMKRTGPNQVLVMFNTSPSSQTELDPVIKLEKLAKLKEKWIEYLKELAKLKEQVTLLMKKFKLKNKNY